MKTPLATWFRSLTTAARKTVVKPPGVRLGLEALEDRRVLNADFDLSAEVTAVDAGDLVGQTDYLSDLTPLPADELGEEIGEAIDAPENIADDGSDASQADLELGLADLDIDGELLLNADFDLSATVTAADEAVGQANPLASLIPLSGDDPVAELSAAIAALGNDYDPSGFDLSAEVTAVGPWDLFGTFEDANPFGLTDVVPAGETDTSIYTTTDWSDALDPADYAEVDVSPLPDIDWASLNPQPLPPHEFEFEVESLDFGNDVDAYALNPQPLPPHEFEVADFGPDLDIYALNPQPLPPMEWSWSQSFVPYQTVTTLSATAFSQVAAVTYRMW